jgi:exodeoxyribonuclease V gamma subunit
MLVPVTQKFKGLYLYTSNRLEALFEDLLTVVRQPLPVVLQPEIIVVQSLGMERWLSLRLADRQGICANFQFPFPSRFLSGIYREVLPESPDVNPFDHDVMTWRLMHILPQMAEKAEFEAVRNYLRGERRALKRFQLASRIAETFDQYLTFRPQMILDWDLGKENHWQALLWRELTGREPAVHQPALALRLAETLRQGGTLLKQSRVSVFGVSTMPKFYLDLLELLSGYIEVQLFVMEPTPHWWQDLVSAREEAKILKAKRNRIAEDLHLERGNSLLASMGRLGRDFLGFLADLDGAIHKESFAEPHRNTILSSIQNDIFALREPERKAALQENDRSIQVHSCHSAMREVEVLHDQLLALLSDRPDLQPQDIIVMMPDVATYAPFIEAVFDTPEMQKHRIPYSIADRSPRAENGVVNTFLALLELAGTRLGPSSLLNILESRAVRARFQLLQADLETVRVWLDEATVRWGIDAAHREKFGLPGLGNNTWREGLDRLLLGYAMAGANAQLFKNILPCDQIEGGQSEVLGNFTEFASSVFETVKRLESERTLGDWQVILRQVLEHFFSPIEDVEREMVLVRSVIESLGEQGEASRFDEPVELDVVRAFLSSAFKTFPSRSGFLLGGVTFCTLKLMRSIAFKVIAVLGMNDTAYPRKPQVIGFDLIAQDPKPGDRSVRDDDRYLFLEALLSAREVFYLSYVGQSIKDNSRLPPSVLITELLDYLDSGFELPERKSAKEFVVTRHRLHPFNADYFSQSDARLFSYSAENCRAGEARRGGRANPPVFVSAPLEEPETEWRIVEIDSLISFFRNPAQFFIKKRLGITLPHREDLLEEREPFALDSLSQYQIEQDLLGKALRGKDLECELPVILASGRLPLGHCGRSTSRKLCADMGAFAGIVARHLNGKALSPVMVDKKIGSWTLGGRIDGIFEGGLASYRPAPLQPKDMLRIWILHLALNCVRHSSSILIGKNSIQEYFPIENSAFLLEGLLGLYWQGLREPLRFFPRTSYALVKAAIEPDNKGDPQRAITKEWREEGSDAYIDHAFRNVLEPLDTEWRDLAFKVFEPLIKASTEIISEL